MPELSENKPNLLIIDDEPSVRNILLELFREKFDCHMAGSGSEAISMFEKVSFDLVLSDIDLGDISGIELVPLILRSSPDTTVVMISGNQTIDHAIEAMRAGAFDYIKKPFDLDIVELAVEKAYDHHILLINKRKYETDLENLVKERTDQLQFLAYHDPITGLPNRMLLEDRLTQALIAERRNGQVALIFIALDNLKKVQDSLGHSLANEVLQAISQRLEQTFGTQATVSRIDGDEFALLIPKLSAEQDVIKVLAVANEIIRQPVTIDKHEVYLTASIGVSIFPADGRSPDILFKKAGAALLRARENGGDNCQYYTPGMNSSAVKRLTIENGLRKALKKGDFTVYYQPKININTGQVAGVEALVRLMHPEFGIMPPDEFIPIAEETGTVVPLGTWVLRQACADIKPLIDSGHELSVAVNVSLKQLQFSGIVEQIKDILVETGLEARHLNLEITESSIMHDVESATTILKSLKELGISISLDDFGTGYSSFGHLKRLPIDVIKIDKSFVQDVTADADGAALVMAMISLAQNLRLKVVAEGVETKEQLSFLNLLRCDEYQGYYFSKPVSVKKLAALLVNTSENGSEVGQ